MVESKVKLLIIQGRPEGKALCFRPGDYFIGRGPECHIRPNSEWVSRQHCLLRVSDDSAVIRDLGSRNGTLLNGVLLEDEHPLQSGDQVQIGPLLFEVRIDGGPPDTVNHSTEEQAEVERTPHDDTDLEMASLAATKKYTIAPPLE